jgi:hypothetical protein
MILFGTRADWQSACAGPLKVAARRVSVPRPSSRTMVRRRSRRETERCMTFGSTGWPPARSDLEVWS